LCSDAGRQGTLDQRLWKNVIKKRGCWVYPSVDYFGYGRIQVGYKQTKAHRLAWELTKGAIPVGMHVCHKCDNPACVRPSHLFLGTDADNIADMDAKGRGFRPGVTLDATRVRRIRRIYAAGRTSQRALAHKFGVSLSTVSGILRGTRWAHVT